MAYRGLKGALKIADKYQSNLSAGKEEAIDMLDDLISELGKYQRKDGQISGRFTSAKSQARIKELISDIRAYDTAKKRKSIVTENKAQTAADKLEKALGMSGKGAYAAAKTFMNYTAPVLPSTVWSEAILTLAESGFDEGSIKNILDFVQNQIDNNIPDEMKAFSTDDDISEFISNLANINELDSSIPLQDAIDLADQMTRFGFDNTEEIIEEYWEDQTGDDDDEEDDE